MVLATSALLAAPGAARGQERTVAAVRKGHPRIFVTAEGLPALRARCRGAARRDFERVISAGWIMTRKCGTDWSDLNNMPMPALGYLVTGEEKYLAKVREFLDALDAVSYTHLTLPTN